MKQLVTIITLGLLMSCTYRPKEKRLSEFGSRDGKILKSFYKKRNDTIEFHRVLKVDNGFIVQTGQITTGQYGLINQELKNYHKLNSDEAINSLITSWATNGEKEKLWDERAVMFIQIIPDTSMSDIDALGLDNLRLGIEDKIDERLKMNNLGEWFAGDMGAGANMLFFIDDWSKANEVIMQVLREEGLVDHVLIAKRVAVTKDDWTYEIVYPLEYHGSFNQM